MYCAPLKPAKAARSVRAQRHTDVPKAQKVSAPRPPPRDACPACVRGPNRDRAPVVAWLTGPNGSILTLDVQPSEHATLQILPPAGLDDLMTRRWWRTVTKRGLWDQTTPKS